MSVQYDPTDRLLHPAVAVRTRAVLALAKRWPDGEDIDTVAGKLGHLLRDAVPSVVEVVTATLDGLVAAKPGFLRALGRAATAGGAVDLPLVGYLLRPGPAAGASIETVLGWLDVPDADDEWLALIEAVARAGAVTDARLERMLDEGSRDQRRAAAAILSRRGVSLGTRILVEEFATRALVSEHIGRGPEGIRTLCSAVPCRHPSDAFIAERLAARRKTTAATVYALAETPALGADRVAVRVLGHWDEPRSVELLCAVAEDPTRSADVREAALGALCALEAPEAIDVLGRAIVDGGADDLTRQECERTLAAIGNHDALMTLREARRKQSGRLRIAVQPGAGGLRRLRVVTL
jgi:hypothetical protein